MSHGHSHTFEDSNYMTSLLCDSEDRLPYFSLSFEHDLASHKSIRPYHSVLVYTSVSLFSCPFIKITTPT